ncbi:FAD-dependent monooxygenase [Alicyclobacillus dauci]|uniref:FAD-dependent monooxygenase n=1 Tax=Alicyclobacillus dauci TaxID=1475485 RepID=A0ABY6Z1G7_9BACL|nr:FAD-dependent monooxygenase [Alicyclobacillus dauci]WAH36532.1 FAD-dependent monooxygenase [Alicyclobacillus dauci]
MVGKRGRLAILGTGIGGLATAMGCRALGIPYTLFDPATDPLQGGAALTLWPHALRALLCLAGRSRLPDWMEPIQAGDVRTARGCAVYELPLEWMERRYGLRPSCVRRVDLSTWMWQELGSPSILRLAAEEAVHVNHGGSVAVRFSDNSTRLFDGVVAADGIHSRIRSQYVGDEPRSTGYTAWRGIARSLGSTNPLRMREYWGPGSRFGYAYIDASSVYWFATVNHSLFSSRRIPTWEDAQHCLLRLPSEVGDMIQHTLVTDVLQHPVQDFAPGAPLVLGRIAFVGDAGHAITPNLGLGACLALEDAVTFMSVLRQARTYDTAFQHYARSRRHRVALIARATRLLGDVTQLENAALNWVRNKAIRCTPTTISLPVWRLLLGEPIRCLEDGVKGIS